MVGILDNERLVFQFDDFGILSEIENAKMIDDDRIWLRGYGTFVEICFFLVICYV